MTVKRTSVFENALIWFGAGVSLAEIMTGTFLAPLGFSQGLLSVIIGHVIGCFLLFLAGCMGGKRRMSAMETVTLSFGSKGAFLFAMLNVLQLVGWTAIMIYDGALAANGALPCGHWIWAVVIGGLIIVWLIIGIKSLGKVNLIAMSALFILTVVLSFLIFRRGDLSAAAEGGLSFGAAIELNVAMPLSWLPLISDYTREAEKPVAASACSAVVYGVVSCWMYIIGLGSALLAGTSDIAEIMLTAGLGIAGLIIIVLSTVTTTFLDAYSAGISSELFSEKIDGRKVAIAAAAIGTAAAIVFPMDDFTDFLYLIGSVFAPMIAVMIADFFILKRDHNGETVCVKNLIIWFAGFLLYRKMMTIDLPIGSTLVDIAAVIQLLEDLLHALDMVIVGGADIAVIADVHVLPQLLEDRDDLVDILLGGDTAFLRLFLYLLTVFVGTGQEHHIVALHPLVAGDTVARDGGIGMPDMGVARGVIDRGRDVKCLFVTFLAHGWSLLVSFVFAGGGSSSEKNPIRPAKCPYTISIYHIKEKCNPNVSEELGVRSEELMNDESLP